MNNYPNNKNRNANDYNYILQSGEEHISQLSRAFFASKPETVITIGKLNTPEKIRSLVFKGGLCQMKIFNYIY